MSHSRSAGPGRHRPARLHVLVAAVVAAVVGALLAIVTPAAGTAAGPAPDDQKIQPKLAKQLEAKGSADFWVYFGAVDTSAARSVDDWGKRGQAVYDTLVQAAEKRQAESRRILDDAGASYRAFWATNAIKVRGGDAALAEELTSLSAVRSLYPSFEVTSEKPTKQQKDRIGRSGHGPLAVEWGIDDINAPDVWSQFGTSGEGMVVASIDSGVDWDHPALKGHYRGTAADGSADHDYNWYDADGSCPDAPCDIDPDFNHGTHTMGTMIGSDGGENQIGVAPGAKWIAASGCCPSDEALIASGEWMLAPTDLAGDNADPTKRPNVVNNSWGTRNPSNEPFMEDISVSWADAGIFGVFANGNSGPGCNTSGSPGSRIVNYSVGNYQQNHSPSTLSSRGAGQNGAIKPDIAAPGTAVRSAMDGGGYQLLSGTSMAAPHVAGTVALLWSAAPALIGDIDGTRALLDGSAVDNPDSQCGGTPENNNVFGEGRLDALAAMQDAPTGSSGQVEGTVTSDGGPVEGATVAFDGEFDRSVTTADDGTFDVTLPAGDYAVTISAFGYDDATADVTVTAGGTETLNVTLTTAPSATVSGTVTDGSGHGWPLYAKIAVEGPAPDVYTDPATGEYSMELPTGTTYSVTVQAQYPGYETTTTDLEVTGDGTQDFAVAVDATTCAANGYQFNTEGTSESFDGTGVPDGWEVVDHAGTGQVWAFDNPGGRDNLTGGDGGFAIVDSDEYGSSGSQDTSLISPSVDMTDVEAPAVGFKQDYNNNGETADVDVSIDGGETWETVLRQTADSRGPDERFVPLPTAAGQSDVQVRFHYYNAAYEWWWQVDDVFIGNRTCDAVGEGGYAVGNVRDNGGAGVNGATVTDLGTGQQVTTVATPDDETNDDGLYTMFVEEAGPTQLEAKKADYGAVTEDVEVAADDAVRTDFELNSASLTVTPTRIRTTAQLRGKPQKATFKITNNGRAPASVELGEQEGGFVIKRADGSRVTEDAVRNAEGAPVKHVDAEVSMSASGPSDVTDAGPSSAGPMEDPWAAVADHPTTIMDNRAITVDGITYSIGGTVAGSGTTDKLYAYDPAALAWSEKASLPGGVQATAVGVVDGKIVVSNGWQGDSGEPGTATYIYDPGADSWSTGAASPTGVSAAGHGVVDGKLYLVGGCTTGACIPMGNKVSVYDVAADSWSTASDYPLAVAFPSCGAVDGKLYCTGGTNASSVGTDRSFSYDPATDEWTEIAAAPIDTWASSSTVANGLLVVNGGVSGTVLTNETIGYDPAAEQWIDLPNSNTTRYRGAMACGIYKVGGSEGNFNARADVENLPGYDTCTVAQADVPWMKLSRTSATIQPGKSVTITVTTTPKVAQPGTYTAGVTIKDDAPGTVGPVKVTMVVKAPKAWGKLTGQVKGTAKGGPKPLPGATVQVNGKKFRMTFSTDAKGRYAYWIPVKHNPIRVIAAKDGYAPKTATAVLKKGKTVVRRFTLRAT